MEEELANGYREKVNDLRKELEKRAKRDLLLIKIAWGISILGLIVALMSFALLVAR